MSSPMCNPMCNPNGSVRKRMLGGAARLRIPVSQKQSGPNAYPPSFSPYRGMARPTYIRTCLMLAGAPACRPLAGGSESHHRLHRVQRLRAGGIDCQRRGKALGTLSMRTTLFPRLVVASIEYTDLEPEELIIKEGFPRRSEVVGDTNPYSHASSVAPSNVETSIPTNGL